MRNFEPLGSSLWAMRAQTSLSDLSRPRSAADRVALWVSLGAGLLLMLFGAVARGETGPQAKRTESFNATLSSGSTVRIENVSGDIAAAPGTQFSATVTIVVAAPTQERANALLRSTIVTQTREDNVYTLRTLWPLAEKDGAHRHRIMVESGNRFRRLEESRCRDCKITAQYDIKVPPGVRAILHTVNGEVRSEGLDADLDLQSVNGNVAARGARRSITAQSVNGGVTVVAQALPATAVVDLKTVNGAVLLTLPAEARFRLSASSMNGVIASTFPLPPRAEAESDEPTAHRAPAPPSPPRRTRAPRPVVVDKDDDEEVTVDLRDLEKELEESMKEVDVEIRRSLGGMDRSMRKMHFFAGNDYSGSIGSGGAAVHASTLNGSITVLQSGTRESDAKKLVPSRRSFSVEVPSVEVRMPRVEVRMPRVLAVPKTMVRVSPGIPEGDEVIRGDVSGDFLATSGNGSYRVGNVSGRVKIFTQAGEIHVGSVGAGADLKTQGGDITIASVRGDLKAHTLAGDVHSGHITGSASVETTGGDVRIDRVGGSADVRTGGGDIVLPGVAGGVQAWTEGGDVRVVLLSREPREAVAIRNGGGDVTLILPRDMHADLDLEVRGDDDSERYIRCDFPEVGIVRRSGSEHGSGAINGGGTRVSVRTSSGTIRVQKAPPAAN